MKDWGIAIGTAAGCAIGTLLLDGTMAALILHRLHSLFGAA